LRTHRAREVMQKINPNKPLKVDRIYLKDRIEPLENCEVFVTDRFLIVSKENVSAPTWYNLDNVEKLVRVRLPEQQSKVRVSGL